MTALSAMKLGPWNQRHPLLGYFALAFAISWGGIVTILGTRGIDLSAMQNPEASLLRVAMLYGPSVSGLIFKALVDVRR